MIVIMIAFERWSLLLGIGDFGKLDDQCECVDWGQNIPTQIDVSIQLNPLLPLLPKKLTDVKKSIETQSGILQSTFQISLEQNLDCKKIGKREFYFKTLKPVS